MNDKQRINKILKTFLSLILVFAIALTSALIVHNRDSKPASVEIKNGLSAYELAVQYGYEGTVEEWLGTLNGKSAYEVAVENGYSGTEKDWTASLKATAGKDGVSIKTASFSSAGELIIKLSDGTNINIGKAVGIDGKNGTNGIDGKDGINGINGVDGKDGLDGVGISSANINEEGQLVLTLSDGTTINLDKVVGMNGADGVSVTNSVINDNGELVLTYSNGQIANLGVVVGTDGKDGVDGTNGTDGKDGADGIDGVNGVDGKDGISVVKSEINSKGELVLTYSDDTVDNLGVVVGADGKDGKDGANGQDGKDGIDGINGINGVDGKDGKDGVNGVDGVGIENITINANGELEITLTSGTTMNLGNIKGTDGKDGQNGKDGIDGTNGVDGKDGVDGINGTDGKDGLGIYSTSINEYGELVLEYTDGTSVNLGTVVGKDGQNGADGKDGKDGINGQDGKDGVDGQNGIDGKDGTDGVDGKDGISVVKSEINADGELVIYYSDNTSAKLGIVVGSNGKDGTNGVDGINGQDGKDGADGEDGKDGIGVSNVEINTAGELVLTFSNNSSINLGCIVGKDGKDGADGKDGTNGVDGKDGVGIANVTISTEGALTVELTNGTILNLGNIKGADGIGISKSEINADGELVLTYTDGNTANLGVVVGVNGVDGEDGKNGADGIGIKTVTLSIDGELSILMTDNSTYNLGNIKGEKGDKGDQGEQGIQGEKGDSGKDGRGIESMAFDSSGQLIVTYTDGTTQNLGSFSGTTGDEILNYTLQADGTYSVKAGKDIAYYSDIVIPATYNGRTVTVIEDNAFDGIKTLCSVQIPNTITTIGDSAFNACSGLVSANLPSSVTAIGESAFSGCASLTGEFSFSDSITCIPTKCFYNCKNLSVIISENIVQVKPYALVGTTFTIQGENYWTATGVLQENWNTTGSYVGSSSTVSYAGAMTKTSYGFVITARWSDGNKHVTEERTQATWTR